MEKYLVVIEKATNNFSSFSPDVWGCVAAGSTVEDTLSHIKEALQTHLEEIVNNNEETPTAKGLTQHIADGVFKEGEIADEYFINEVEIAIPQHA